MAIVKVTAGIKSDVRQRIARVVLDLDHLNGSWVQTGWDRNEKYPDGTSVARVALWNEFGTHNADGSVHSPARPFMRPAYRNNKSALMALQITCIRDMLAGTITPEKALNILGYRMWTYVRTAILSNPPPPNKNKWTSKSARDGKAGRPSTEERKRAAGRPLVTLIDTRRMLDTLSYKIYLGGKGRVPMKDEPDTGGGGTGGGGGGVKVKPQNSPKANEHPLPGATGKIPSVRTPDEIRREKKSLQDELRRAKREAKGPKGPGAPSPKTPSPNAPVKRVGGKKTSNRTSPPKSSGKKKTNAPRAKKPVVRTKRSNTAKKIHRVKKAVGKSVKSARRKVRAATKRVRKAVRRVTKAVKRAGKVVRRTAKLAAKRARKALRAARKSLGRAMKSAKRFAKAIRRNAKAVGRNLKKARRQLNKAARAARKIGRTVRRASMKASSFERSLLRQIIALSRAASRYGRSL